MTSTEGTLDNFEQLDDASKKKLDKWCWGAFLLCPFWGIRFRVWVALLYFLPFANFVVSVFLGFHGKKRAWVKGNYKPEDLENFLKTQKNWGIAGAIMLGAIVIISIVTTYLVIAHIKSLPNATISKNPNNNFAYFETSISSPTTIKKLQQQSEKGDPEAMSFLGELYLEGVGVQKNLTTAAEWFKKAADKGDTEAQYQIGRMYLNGEGVEQNDAEAYFYFQLAALADHPSALSDLGMMLWHGRGTAVNLPEAAKSFEKSIKTDPLPNGLVHYNLGMIYIKNKHIEKEKGLGLKHLKIAADLGDEVALSSLGGMYLEGEHVDRNIEKGITLIKQAAMRGSVLEQFYLGVYYATGKYVKKDLNEAKKWWQMAADNGDKMASENLAILEESTKQ